MSDADAGTATPAPADTVSVTHRPTRVSTVVALLAAAAAVVVVEPRALAGCAVEIVGLAVASRGTDAVRDGSRPVGVAGLVVGAAVTVAGVGLAVGSVSGIPFLLQAVLGTVGLGVVGLGVLPVRGTGSRLFVKVGAALLLLCVVAAGLFQNAAGLSLLLACTTVVVSWDAAENAINVGEQLGRDPTTWTVESAHLGGTFLAGGVAVAAGLVVGDLGTPGLPLHSLALLLVSLVFLTLALHD